MKTKRINNIKTYIESINQYVGNKIRFSFLQKTHKLKISPSSVMLAKMFDYDYESAEQSSTNRHSQRDILHEEDGGNEQSRVDPGIPGHTQLSLDPGHTKPLVCH